MAYKLPDLPYDFNALEPHIDEQTLRIHHGKHHAGYVERLNKALEAHQQQVDAEIGDLIPVIAGLPDTIRRAVQQNGGQHYNHSLYWECMCPAGSRKAEPTGALAQAINSTFESFDKFKQTFQQAAVTCFGAGWAWLYVDIGGKLAVRSSSNEINPLMRGITDQPGQPLLVVDVWEHAYYLKYQNRRPEYLEAWWNVVNWDAVAEHFEQAKAEVRPV